MEKWQERERRRRDAVDKAVAEGDRIILDASDGSEEETDYLTASVALRWADKAMLAQMRRMSAKDFAADAG